VRIAFCEFVKREAGGFSTPEKYFFNVAIPELIHKSEESLTGINDLEGMTKCFLEEKNFNHISLISLVDKRFIIINNYNLSNNISMI
jgi:hypothetical protein